MNITHWGKRMAVQSNAKDSVGIEIVNRQVAQIAKLEARNDHNASKADIEKLRADMEKMKSDLTWRAS